MKKRLKWRVKIKKSASAEKEIQSSKLTSGGDSNSKGRKPPRPPPLPVFADSMIEVAGLTNGWHTLSIMLSMDHGKRLTQ
eukprot:6199987-Pyramimonas_sp.AAC.1